MARRDIVVVGAGITGLSIAWELARRGVAVTVLTSSRPPASEVAAGILAPMPEAAINPPLARLAVEALREYPDYLERLSADTKQDPGFRRSGVLRLAYSAAEVEELRESVGQYEAAGLSSEWLSARACLARVPELGAYGLLGGLLSEEEGQVQASWLLQGLREAGRRRHIHFEDADVAEVESRGSFVRLRTAAGKDIDADIVVLALGSWTALLPGLGYLLRPIKGQLLVFRDIAGPKAVLFHGPRYLLSKPDGSVILGATMEDEGFSLEVTDRAEMLRQDLPRIWPELEEAPAETLVGLRPAAPDLLPVVGFLPELPNVYVFSAHHRNGFLVGPFTAAMAAAELSGEERHHLLAPLHPARLRAPAPA